MITPPYLKSGDTIAVVSTARSLAEADLKPFLAQVNKYGLKVKLGKNLFARYNQFAGTDAQRLSDFTQALLDPEVKAIFCARGGYGTVRIIDAIPSESFRQYPKWVIGFSDITVLLCAMFRAGVESIHGTMPISLNTEQDPQNMELLMRLLQGETVQYTLPEQHSLNRTGVARGRVVGGNLSLVQTLTGTATDLHMDGSILFLEDLDEYLYHIDRMMMHLKRSGKLTRLAGLIVGGFTKMNDNETKFGATPYEIIYEAVKDFSYPVFFGFPVGHQPRNFPLIVGRFAELSVSPVGSQLLFDHRNAS
jgi:muramoyltetrapeptide carboxypeptidase